MQRDTLISWLNDAHAMETHLLPVLRNHAKDAKDDPPLAQRIEEHIAETEQHADRVRQAVERLGGSISSLKSGLASIMGMAQSVSTGLFSDEPVKNVLMDYAAEQFEVAAYTALIAAAEEVGEPDVAALCRENLHDDQLMAAWLENHLPTVVTQTLQKLATKTRG